MQWNINNFITEEISTNYASSLKIFPTVFPILKHFFTNYIICGKWNFCTTLSPLSGQKLKNLQNLRKQILPCLFGLYSDTGPASKQICQQTVWICLNKLHNTFEDQLITLIRRTYYLFHNSCWIKSFLFLKQYSTHSF